MHRSISNVGLKMRRGIAFPTRFHDQMCLLSGHMSGRHTFDGTAHCSAYLVFSSRYPDFLQSNSEAPEQNG